MCASDSERGFPPGSITAVDTSGGGHRETDIDGGSGGANPDRSGIHGPTTRYGANNAGDARPDIRTFYGRDSDTEVLRQGIGIPEFVATGN